jgi:flavin-dependent dehydrogenase
VTDVVIIGAGPAGSSLALRLARDGYDVTLVERSRFPRTKVCGDYLCAGVINGLKELHVDGAVLAGAYRISSVELRGFGANVRLALPGAAAASLPRAAFDNRLLAQARSAGARVMCGVFLRAEATGRATCVTCRDEHGVERTLQARVLVGADGAWSAVAQRAGMVGDTRRAGRWAIGGHLPDPEAGDTLHMYVGARGYYARNPLSASTANSMLVLPYPARAEDADAIVEEMTNGNRRFEPENVERLVAIGPLRYRASRVISGRTLLTGDAAELLDPFTGQGVASAIALSAPASAAVSALLRGEPEQQVAKNYAAQWRAIVAPRRALTNLVEAVVRIGFLRDRAVRNIRRDAGAAHALLASVSGITPARDALAQAVVSQLLAS